MQADRLIEKNDRLNHILEDFIDAKGIITIDGAELQKELLEIFE